MKPSLTRFISDLDEVVSRPLSDRDYAAEAERLLAVLLQSPDDLLEASQCETREDSYSQHLIHCDPGGKYSVVALAWRPGQTTPIHDHRCWCVVGVVQGRECETRYELRDDDGDLLLVAGQEAICGPGHVSALVPPEENIHRVANAGDDIAISLHIYGTDIGRLGTSINQVFDHPVAKKFAGEGHAVAWRERPGNAQSEPRI